MKIRTEQAPLMRDDDSEDLRQKIGVLKARGYRVFRPGLYHVKVGPYNWYWNSGKIVIDPCERHTTLGFDAFVMLIEKSVGKSNSAISSTFKTETL